MVIRAQNAWQGGSLVCSAGAPGQLRSASRGVAGENVLSLLCGVSLLKKEGAIHGVWDKFTADSSSGLGSVSVLKTMDLSRSGFGPQVTLSYDSGAGDSPLGLGWGHSLSSITRKTDKDLSKYRDDEESDMFILSGAEDVAPVVRDQGGRWVRDSSDHVIHNVAYDPVVNFLQTPHRGSDAAHSGRTRVYRASQPSQIEPGKQSNRLTSTPIGRATETYGSGGDSYRCHTSESGIERGN